MRMVLGLVSLLVALAIVAVLAKKQLGATRVAVPPKSWSMAHNRLLFAVVKALPTY